MIKILQLYAVLLLAIPAPAMNSDSVIISGLKSSYAKGEPIKFSIKNDTNHDVYISYSLLALVEEGEWFDQIPDLKNYNCNSQVKVGIVYNLLKANETASVMWHPKKANKQYCFNWLKYIGTFRIEVRFAEHKDAMSKNFTSSSFSIK
ncbi:hypothetical protein TH63_15740 [Rufibacter radiotolerans]|uniref:Uncharacterized protein n=2 Tax=Rufibacter radiotolerans TaxID=1379910 RepID=A0A0H4VSK6_9BACT|nr:hypothetical protein TH63_15740 [Rufibacter radiotolerans]